MKLFVKKVEEGGASMVRQEGVVLFLTMLVIVTLAMIGTIGIRSVQFELSTSGNVRQATQTRYISDVGAMASIWMFGGSGRFDAFLKEMESSNCNPPNEKCGPDYYIFNLDDFASNDPPIFVTSGGSGSYHSLGYAPLSPGFVVTANNGLPVYVSQYLAGFALSHTMTSGENPEFQKWMFTSEGSARLGTTDNRTNSVETLRVTTVLGPTFK